MIETISIAIETTTAQQPFSHPSKQRAWSEA